MTARGSKGRFIKNTCPVKKAKITIRKFWKDYKAPIILVVCVWLAITGAIWLFGDKVTSVCHSEEEFRFNETAYWSSTVSWESTWGFEEEYTDPCAWTSDTHSYYTPPESIGVEWDFIAGIGKWFLSHPVI
jgi:hypothetical protein